MVKIVGIGLLWMSTAWAGSIAVSNPSFETGSLPTDAGNGPFNQLITGDLATGGSLADWTASASTGHAAAGAFAPAATGSNWSSVWWDGSNVGYVQAFADGTSASLSQTLADVLQPDTTYTLSALIGRRIFTPEFDYSLQLWAGNTLLASASNLALLADTSGTDSAQYISGTNDPSAGLPLEIVFTTTGAGGQQTEAFIDQVTLTATSPLAAAPEPSALWLTSLPLFGIAALRYSCRKR